MRNTIDKKTLESAIAAITSIALVALLYLGAHFFFGITCPIKWFTGISCAGCGMTRAWLSVLRLDFYDAFYYHPLFWTVPIFLIVFINRVKIGDKLYKRIVVVVVLLFVGVYIWRMLTPGEIVVFRPEDGLVYRIFSLITKKGGT